MGAGEKESRRDMLVVVVRQKVPWETTCGGLLRDAVEVVNSRILWECK